MSDHGQIKRVNDDGESERNDNEGDPGALISREQLEISGFRGPLPDPDTLLSYEHIIAGLADRITRMAETEQHHRHAKEMQQLELKREELHQKGTEDRLGFIGFVLINTLPYAVGLTLALSGQSAIGLVPIVTTLGIHVVSIIHRYFLSDRESRNMDNSSSDESPSSD